MSVCLCMIVKNEAALIQESLRSVLPYIDRWSIVDTGSIDGTQDIICREMKDKPGELHNRTWKNYGESRTEALELARKSGCDWILILDADETIKIKGLPSVLNSSVGYWATVNYGGISYSRPNLIHTGQNWRYVGITHEYLAADPMPPSCLLPITITTHPSRCTKSVERCEEDIRILKEALLKEPKNERYVFYLAQSYRDSGQVLNAIHEYNHRINMGGWREEVFYAQLQVAHLMAHLCCSQSDVVDAYLRAYEINPDRSESLGSLARYLRMANQFNMAFMMAEKACSISRPNEHLFVDDSYYEWRNLDELAVAAYWTGRYTLCQSLCNRLLESGKLPESEVSRVKDNVVHAENKILEKLARA